MNKDDIKKLVARKIGVSSSESDLASQILLDSIAENLTGTKNAVNISGLGIFQVTDNKKELIYSPAEEEFSGEAGSFYMRLDVPNPPAGDDEFDEDIFSLSVGKPTVASNKAAEEGGTSYLVIRKQIEERVRDILSESDYYDNYNLLESLGINTAQEDEPVVQSTDDDEIENVFNIKEDEEDEVQTPGDVVPDDEASFNLAAALAEENSANDVPEKEEETKDEAVTDDEPRDNMKNFFERLNEIESREDESAEEGEGETETGASQEPEAESVEPEETADEKIMNEHFRDPVDFYSYPERDEEEEKKKVPEPEDEDEDADFATLRNLMMDDEDEPDPQFEEPRVLNSAYEDEEPADEEEEEVVLETPKTEDDDVFSLDEELDKTSVDDEDENDQQDDWNWGDEQDGDAKNDENKDDEDPFDTLERTLMEDDTDELSLEEEAAVSAARAAEEEEEPEDYTLAAALSGEHAYEDINDVKGSSKREDAAKKLKSFRDNSSMGSLIVIAAFCIIIGAVLYFLFFSGGTAVDESSNIPSQEEILENTSEVSSTPEQETPSEGVTDEITEPAGTEEAIPTPVNNADANTVTDGTDNSSKNNNNALYREYPNEVRISNLISKNGNSYSVQVSSWKNPIKAENEAKRLKAAGYDAYIINAYLPAKGGTWHRVRIGGFKSVEDARTFSNEYQN